MLINIVISIITSSLVSFIWSKWFIHNLTRWMDKFFDEELERIKKLL